MPRGPARRRMRAMNRFLPVILTAVALSLLGAGSASANSPMAVVLEAPSTFTVTDGEVWRWSSKSWTLAGTTIGPLPAGNGVFNYKHVRCYGGEVRGELFIDGYRWSNTNAVT